MTGSAQPIACPAPVAILMATYNNAAYLEEQIASISAQTFRDWHLYIQDDGSKDATLAVAEACRARDPARITIYENARNLGARNNFAQLLNRVDAPYLMCCDGDDVWEPRKIERSLTLMQRFERRFSATSPMLLHSDLLVVDRELRLQAPSLWRLQGRHPRHTLSFRRNLISNAITGCTVMINRPLRDRALPIPDAAIMHDWWLALVASAFGHVIYLALATVRYRQHGGNAVGARRWNSALACARALGVLAGDRRFHLSVDRIVLQGRAFLARYAGSLAPCRLSMLAGVAWPARDPFRRLRHLRTWRLYKHNLLSTLGFMLLFCCRVQPRTAAHRTRTA